MIIYSKCPPYSRRAYCFQVCKDCYFQSKESRPVQNSEAGHNSSTDVVSYLSSITFASLESMLSKPTLLAIAEMGLTKMTEIQAKCIEPLLQVMSYI